MSFNTKILTGLASRINFAHAYKFGPAGPAGTVWNVISAKIILLYYKVKCCKGGRFFFTRALVRGRLFFIGRSCDYGRRIFSKAGFHSYPVT